MPPSLPCPAPSLIDRFVTVRGPAGKAQTFTLEGQDFEVPRPGTYRLEWVSGGLGCWIVRGPYTKAQLRAALETR